MKTYSKFTLWIILASATLTVMAGSLIAPVLNLMREGLGADPASAAIIITTHGILIALCSPLIGFLIDRVGVKKPFVSGLVLYGLAGASGLFITSYWVLIISRVFFGIAVAAIYTSLTVMILNLYEGVDRNRVMGWRGSSNSFGGVIWPLLGGFLGRFSWHLPFAAYLVGIPLGILALFAVPDVHQEKIHDTSDVSKKGSVLQILKNTPILFIIYGLMFLANILLYAIVVFVPQLLEKIDISNPFYIGLFISTTAFSAGLTSLMYGRIKEKLSYKMIVVTALALWAVGFTTISQMPYSWIIGPSIALFGIGQGMVLPTLMVWVGALVPISFRGRISSYLATFGYVGQF
ncbi:MAG: MFS transporter, partial [Deltaproteobacteria bacterium]